MINDDIKVMLKEAGILTAITLVLGLLLGFVYELTKAPIAVQEAKAITEACNAVFASAIEFEEIEVNLSSDVVAELSSKSCKVGKVYLAYDANKNVLGYVIDTTSSAGYGGDIEIYTGISADRTVNAVSILKISETAGLGMNAESVLVPQFKNKKVDSFAFTKNGSVSPNEIDAISGATITTRAFTNAVNSALSVFDDIALEVSANE